MLKRTLTKTAALTSVHARVGPSDAASGAVDASNNETHTALLSDYEAYPIPLVFNYNYANARDRIDDAAVGRRLGFLKNRLDLPFEAFAVQLCQVHPPLLAAAKDEDSFDRRLDRLIASGFGLDQIAEVPQLFSVDSDVLRSQRRSLEKFGYDSSSGHPLFLLPSLRTPAEDAVASVHRRRPRRAKGSKEFRPPPSPAQLVAEWRDFLSATEGLAERTNAAFLARALGTDREQIYWMSLANFPAFQLGYKFAKKISTSKEAGLDSYTIRRNWNKFTVINSHVLGSRLSELSKLGSIVGRDLVDSRLVFAPEAKYRVRVHRLRVKLGVGGGDYPESVKSRARLIATLLDVPVEIVIDFLEVHETAINTFFRSRSKLAGMTAVLKEAGFSGPEILRRHTVLRFSAYNVGRSIRRVRDKFQLGDGPINDAYLEEVVRMASSDRVTADYHLLTKFSLASLAATLEVDVDDLVTTLDVATRGRLKAFAAELRREDGGNDDDNYNDDNDDDADAPAGLTVTLERNAASLRRLGFFKESLTRCLALLANPCPALSSALAHADLSPERLRRLSAADQIRILNLLLYRIEKDRGFSASSLSSPSSSSNSPSTNFPSSSPPSSPSSSSPNSPSSKFPLSSSSPSSSPEDDSKKRGRYRRNDGMERILTTNGGGVTLSLSEPALIWKP